MNPRLRLNTLLPTTFSRTVSFGSRVVSLHQFARISPPFSASVITTPYESLTISNSPNNFFTTQMRNFSEEFREPQDRRPRDPACRLYVTNLPKNVQWTVIKDHFKQAGNVLFVENHRDLEGQFKGTATVVFSQPDEAAEAIETLNGSTLSEHPDYIIGVQLARVVNREPRQFAPRQNSVYCYNLPYVVTTQDLIEHMKQVGNVTGGRVFADKNGMSKGCGFVEYESHESVHRAIEELNKSTIPGTGRHFFVREDQPQSN